MREWFKHISNEGSILLSFSVSPPLSTPFSSHHSSYVRHHFQIRHVEHLKGPYSQRDFKSILTKHDFQIDDKIDTLIWKLIYGKVLKSLHRAEIKTRHGCSLKHIFMRISMEHFKTKIVLTKVQLKIRVLMLKIEHRFDDAYCTRPRLQLKKWNNTHRPWLRTLPLQFRITKLFTTTFGGEWNGEREEDEENNERTYKKMDYWKSAIT